MPTLVITEVAYLIETRLGWQAEVRFLGDLAGGNFAVEPPPLQRRPATTRGCLPVAAMNGLRHLYRLRLRLLLTNGGNALGNRSQRDSATRRQQLWSLSEPRERYRCCIAPASCCRNCDSWSLRAPVWLARAIRLIGALSKDETRARLARLNRLRRKLLREAPSSPRQSTLPPPRIGELPRAIAKVLADAPEPMHVSDIRDAVERLLGHPVNYRSVKGRLSEGTLLRKSRFKRVARGCYELTVASSKTPSDLET